VETLITAMSLRGYCRTASVRIDCRPAIRITRLTTTAEDRAPDEEVGPLHQLSSGFGAVVLAGWMGVVDLDRREVPELEGPGAHDFRPRGDPGTRRRPGRPRATPSFTNCWRTPRYGLPSGPFICSTTNTESP